MNTWLSNKWALSGTAGILLALSFPPVNLSFLSIPAFILFFKLIDECESYKQTAYYTYLGFLIWNLGATYWLMMASIGAGTAAILANSVLMTIPLALSLFFSRKFSSPFLVALLQASAWVSYEFLHHHWDLAWPWLAIGNAWSNHIGMIQYISITGHLGISFWVVFTAALATQTIKYKSKLLLNSSIASLLVLPLLSLIYFAVSELPSNHENVTRVAVIQPNHDSYEDYGGMSGAGEVLDSLFSITQKTRLENTELIVWPENAIDKPIFFNSYTSQRIADSARAWNTDFIVGTGLYTIYDEEPDLYRGLINGRPYNVFNSALYVENNGFKSRYDKANLVPIVERFPFLPFFSKIDVFGWIDWGRQAGFGQGNTPDMLEAETYSTPGLVCYDSVYPSWTRKFVTDGADFITIITNDGWWGNSSGHLQHFAYARLRAIEFDRWIVRSANNGTSGIIRPDGTIEQKTDYWIRTGFTSTIPNVQTSTLYARFGDWVSYLTLALTFLGLLIGRFRKAKAAVTSNE
ncbi:MAG: apolipoprotein N-acyltransferase [Balneola sp.]|nr:MAG: apolipoprotein N-acyltransferase [Balneola sp.]